MGADTLPVELDVLLDRLDFCQRAERTVADLPGGLTNRNVRVTTPDRDVVVRISRKDSDLLFIDRDAEYANSVSAAASGAAPQVVEFSRDDHLLVVEFVAGTTLTAEDVRDEANIPRVAQVCRQLHSGPRFVNDFDMFEVQRTYLQLVTSRGFRLPDRYVDFMPTVERIREALEPARAATVPCNNDLLAANFIDSGTRLWLIDFEYSGNNDPCFELGNIASESHLSTEQLAHLVTAYYGQELPDKTARAQLMGLLANYGWTLWASIQDATSPIDFDFWSWGMEKYERAVALFDGPELDRLLTAVRRSD